MLGNRETNASLQSDFYRDHYRKLLRWLAVMIAVIFFLIVWISYALLFQPNITFYANTVEGKILPMPSTL
jgi:hypothetical protein